MAQKLSDIIPISNLKDYKAHCAVRNPRGFEPLDAFLAGRMDDWNGYKPGRNDFNRKYIFSMVRFYPEGDDIWLFCGIFEVRGIKEYTENGENREKYIIEQSDKASEYIGKLKLHYQKLNYDGSPMRQSRLCLETIYDEIDVAEILPNIYTG